jgi:hypothetical protein
MVGHKGGTKGDTAKTIQLHGTGLKKQRAILCGLTRGGRFWYFLPGIDSVQCRYCYYYTKWNCTCEY